VSDWIPLLPLAVAMMLAVPAIVFGLLGLYVVRRGGPADLKHVADLVRAWRGRDP
jgi:ABC-type phosphate transport system permease subunit